MFVEVKELFFLIELQEQTPNSDSFNDFRSELREILYLDFSGLLGPRYEERISLGKILL